MIKKAIILLLLLILILFLLVIGGSFILLGTDSGFRWTATKLESVVPGLSISETTGNLESGITTDKVNWQRGGTSVDISGMSSTWRSGCLFKYTYCLDKLDIDELRITSRPTAQQKKPGNGEISLPQIKLPLAVDADEISIGKLIIDTVPGKLPIELENVFLQANASSSNVHVKWLRANYKNYAVRISGDVELTDDYPMQGTVTLTAKNLIAGKDLTGSLSFSNTLRSLHINGYVAGALGAKITGTINPLTAKLPLDVQFEWDNNGWPLDTRTTVQTTNAQLTLHGDLDDYQLALTSDVSGQQVPDTQVNIQGAVNPQRALLHRIDLLTLDGFSTGSGAITWTDNLTWVAELIAKKINPGVKWPDMFGQLDGLAMANGHVSKAGWTLNLTTGKVNGNLRNFPFSLDTVVNRSADEVWQVKSLDLDNGPNTLSLTGTYGDTLDIDASLDFPAVHFLIPSIAGDLAATARITGELATPNIELTANSSLLKASSILLRDMKLDTTINEAANEDSALALTVGILNASSQEIKNVKIDLAGSRAGHEIAGRVDGPHQTSVTLGATGALSDTLNWQGQLLQATVGLPAHALMLQDATELAWNQETRLFSIDPHCWLQHTATLCLDKKIEAAKNGTAVISLNAYSLNTLNELLPSLTQVGGTLGANGKFAWGNSDEDAFSAEFVAAIDDGSITLTDANRRRHQFTYKSLNLTGRVDPYTITSDLQISSDAMGNGRVALTLNPKSSRKNIVGEVSLQDFDIGFIRAFLPEIDEIEGNVSVAGDISGSLSEPDFNGQINLENPVLRATSLPLSIDGGNIVAEVIGSRADINGELRSGDGSITLGGNVSWPQKNLRASITVDGESLLIKQKPIIHSMVHPALRINYKNHQLNVGGNVRIPSADINIKALPEGTTTLSDDVIIIEEQKNIVAVNEEAGSLKTVIDVDVELGDDINLNGYGLEARLTGDFNVGKTGAAPPQLLGEVRVLEGFYKSYGQDLTIEDGQILFVGPIEQTTLNIDAVRVITAESRVAGLRLTGQIADPTVSLFTEPADKTQESILSYIVLGRDIGNNTSGESNLLATAALALTIKEGKGFATGFAESLGISDFTLEADGSGDDTQVVLSGRLSSKLLLRYGRSVFVPEQTLFLRYDISRRLYLEAAQGVERAVDLFYSFSF